MIEIAAVAGSYTFDPMHTMHVSRHMSARNFICLLCMLPQHRLPAQKDMKVLVLHSLLPSQLLPWGHRAKRSCSRYLWKSTCRKNQICMSQQSRFEQHASAEQLSSQLLSA